MPRGPRPEGIVTAGSPVCVHSEQKVASPVFPSPSGASPAAGMVAIASKRSKAFSNQRQYSSRRIVDYLTEHL